MDSAHADTAFEIERGRMVAWRHKPHPLLDQKEWILDNISADRRSAADLEKEEEEEEVDEGRPKIVYGSLESQE